MMNIKQAIDRLKQLGFEFPIDDFENEENIKWGCKSAESFSFSPNHIVTHPKRDVFIGVTQTGFYITSDVYFEGRYYGKHHDTDIHTRNIFASGKTLEEAITQFEKNFNGMVLNVTAKTK